MCDCKWMTWLQISPKTRLCAFLGELRAGRVYFCSLCSFLKGLFCLFPARASRGFHPRLLPFLNPAPFFLNLSELNRLLLEKKQKKQTTKRLMWLQLRVGEAAAAERAALNRGQFLRRLARCTLNPALRAWDKGQKILALETQITPPPHLVKHRAAV